MRECGIVVGIHGSVICPGCGGRDFRAVYRVQTVCEVELTRAPDGEVLIGPPGSCVSVAPEPTERDFYELLCGHCGGRLDWELDHRSLYVRERV